MTSRPKKLDRDAVDTWLAAHEGWSRRGEDAIAKGYAFADFAAAMAFAVRVGMLAERRDHHPDLAIGWGKAHVTLTTHDAAGVTTLDLELAAAVDGVAATFAR